MNKTQNHSLQEFHTNSYSLVRSVYDHGTCNSVYQWSTDAKLKYCKIPLNYNVKSSLITSRSLWFSAHKHMDNCERILGQTRFRDASVMKNEFLRDIGNCNNPLVFKLTNNVFCVDLIDTMIVVTLLYHVATRINLSNLWYRWLTTWSWKHHEDNVCAWWLERSPWLGPDMSKITHFQQDLGPSPGPGRRVPSIFYRFLLFLVVPWVVAISLCHEDFKHTHYQHQVM